MMKSGVCFRGAVAAIAVALVACTTPMLAVEDSAITGGEGGIDRVVPSRDSGADGGMDGGDASADSGADAGADTSADSAPPMFLVEADPPMCPAGVAACPARTNTTAACVAGACRYACTGTYGDCNSEARDGCELDLAANANHCGACGRACSGSLNATATCAAGACVLSCNSGFADCDRDRANGCEADLQRNANNCGTCATRCAAGANGAAQCASGVCGLGCNAGFANCDGDLANGCELSVSSDVNNCGACGTRCPSGANGVAACTAGACELRCAAGFANCDGSVANGCEVELATTSAHCGRCGNSCPATANTTAVCRASACATECNAGFADCDGNPATGCEADTRASVSHCGGCGRVCTSPRPGTVATCGAGVCASSCAPNFADCDADPSNGCEINVNVSPMNCGACGTRCPMLPNANPTCSAGVCGSTCAAGFSDCDGNSANGCERPGTC